MIIRISPGDQMTCVALRLDLCEARPLKPEDVDITMRRMGLASCEVGESCPVCSGTLVKSPFAYKGTLCNQCGFQHKPKIQRVPGIRYCGWQLDGEGRVCFLWDDKLLKAPRGRYRGTVRICGQEVGCLDFHLGARYRAGDADPVQANCDSTVC